MQKPFPLDVRGVVGNLPDRFAPNLPTTRIIRSAAIAIRMSPRKPNIPIGSSIGPIGGTD
jgi:hypothetical protein